MFRITRSPSSGSFIEYLAKIKVMVFLCISSRLYNYAYYCTTRLRSTVSLLATVSVTKYDNSLTLASEFSLNNSFINVNSLFKCILISFDMCYFYLFCTILGTCIPKKAFKINITDFSIIFILCFLHLHHHHHHHVPEGLGVFPVP